MLDKSDPRAALASYGAGTAKPVERYSPAEHVSFADTRPQESSTKHKTWWARGQNFILGYSEASTGARFLRSKQPDEYVVLLPDRSSKVLISTAGGQEAVAGYTLTIVPPGDSEIIVSDGGRLIRVFSSESDDLGRLCSNADSYREVHPNVALLRPWPAPATGFRLRSYSLDVPDVPGRFGKIFMCSTMMINYQRFSGPRDTAKLSPHSHDDFEQGSMVVEGECIHHVRFPWVSDQSKWIDDEHTRTGSPSLTILPPPSIHTSAWIDRDHTILLDIFSPPRIDWSEQPGWVLNADEYPKPAKA